ncbi:putative methyltransferase DDB_G0268948 [Amia ocellicauda]|uniref:putative methyltransferase DDB_G0268948 n=1 Tax=Amia ocellicauda TaxID=2972642 RepID=UPI0034649E12
MATRMFEGKHHATLYQKYRFAPPDELKTLILDYLDKKKGPPHLLAVDLGCGTGQNTRLMAPLFKEMVGIDVSESQVEEARAVPGFPNITYRVGTAEKLPFPDGSVDVILAASAAHWFHTENFVKEAGRVLKPLGCLALMGFGKNMEYHYGNCEGRLTDIFNEFTDALLPYTSKQVAIADSALQEVLDAIPFPEKERVDNLPVTYKVPVQNAVGFFESFSMFQAYERADPTAARALLETTQRRFLEEMGDVSPEMELDVVLKYFCVLACKPR